MANQEFLTEAEIHRDTAIGADVNSAFVEQAALFAHYGRQAAKALKQVGVAKLTLEIREAKIDKEIREGAATSGSKITEASIKTEIARNAEYIKAKMAVIDAEAIYETHRSACEAMRHKRDMLIQIGLTEREEMKGELRMQAATAGAEAKQRLLDRMAAGTAAA